MSSTASLAETLGTAAALVAVGGSAVGIYRAAMSWYHQTVGSRRILAARVNQLAAGATTRWVEERLGPPAFVGGFCLPPEHTPPPGQPPPVSVS